MTNIIIQSDNANCGNLAAPTIVGCVPQTGAAYARLVAVASSAPAQTQPFGETGRILRLPEVINRVGLCRASIYQHMNQGSFPRTIPLGLRAVGWLENEVDAWIHLHIARRK